MIPKADRDADKAILAAATPGTWIAVLPSSQDGGVQLAGFGPAIAPRWSTATSLRVGGTDSNTAERAGDIAVAAARMTMEQHAANAKAAAHAVNRLPKYIVDAAEMEIALSALVTTIPRCDGGLGDDDALPCCKPGQRQPAMWGADGELIWCDGHHAAGYGEEQLPYAAAARVAIAILRGIA